MADLPAQVKYGRVRGTILRAVVDGPDAGDDPDATPATGTVTFTPELTGAIAYAGLASTVVVPATEVVTLVDGSFNVRLIATDVGNPVGWTWKVSWQLDSINLPAFSIGVATDSDRQITEWVPAGASAGVLTLRGPKGDKGDTGAPGSGVIGTWTASPVDPLDSGGDVEEGDVWVDTSDTDNPVIRVFVFAGGTFAWRPSP